MIRQRAKFVGMLLGLSILAGCSSSGSGGGGGGGGGPAPTVNLTVTPGSIIAGQSVTLTWQSTNATSVVIDNNFAVQPPSGGSVTLPSQQSPAPAQTHTYNAVATGNGQQAMASATVTVSPVNAFDGMAEDSTNQESEDIDPNGAVGTHQFIEYVNTEFQAFDKKTFTPVTINGASSSAPQSIGAPWNNLVSSPCADPGIQLDGVIDFDRLASRWVIAAKAVRTATIGGRSLHVYDFCIAVSTTDDVTSPSFAWFSYTYQLYDNVLKKDSKGNYYFPDWPKLGTWPDAYYATMDLQDLDSGSAEVGVAVCAFDRANMLNGVVMRTPQCFVDGIQNNSVLMSNGIYLGHSLIPADVDGITAPPAGRDEFLISIQNPVNNNSSTTSNTLNLWNFHLDWTTPANSTFTRISPSPSVNTYTPGCYLFVPGAPALTNCVAEPAGGTSGQTVDSVGDRLMPRFAYRNFGPHESFLISHTIQGDGTGPNPLQTAIRWYELRANGAGTPSIFQSGTINPDTKLFRFLPSIAQDKDGNAAVGYSVSNSLTNPGIDFSYWSLGTLNAPTTEATIVSGPAEEITPNPPFPFPGRGAWGSYSGMTVDPMDDCTFWYVNEYWVPIPDQLVPTSWATKISNFKLPTCK